MAFNTMPIAHYPEIRLVYRVPEIFAVKGVVAVEKLHGSCMGIGFPLGMSSIDEIQFRSREVIYDPTNPSTFPLGVAIQWFKKRPELLTSMWEVIKSYGFSEVTLFGEAYGPGIKAKGIRYSEGSEMLFRAFDIMVGANFLTYDLFCEVCDKMGVLRVHEIWRGEPTQSNFDALLNQPSVEAMKNGVEQGPNTIAEGVVIRSNPLLRDVFGQWLIVKHKGTKFSEVAHAATESKVRTESPADGFATMYVTEGRLENAVLRLLNRGVELKNEMSDMPAILTEMIADLQKECLPEMQALKIPEKDVRGAVSRILGPLYRARLAKS